MCICITKQYLYITKLLIRQGILNIFGKLGGGAESHETYPFYVDSGVLCCVDFWLYNISQEHAACWGDSNKNSEDLYQNWHCYENIKFCINSICLLPISWNVFTN
jgi:hypothetical protein